MSTRGAECARMERGSPAFPPGLGGRLGAEAPAVLFARGDPSLLRLPLTAVFCSVRLPAELALPAYDLARSLRDAAVPVIGGFQSPVERDCLDYLLRGEQPVVVSPARDIVGMRLPRAWAQATEAGRMLILSRFHGVRRPTRALAARRNRLVAALAERICVVHASPGGTVRRVVGEALSRATPVLCLAHPENQDLVLRGALPVEAVPSRGAGGPAPAGEILPGLRLATFPPRG